MSGINVLDKKTAELIAAGEVVERPASVIKELLENALDSGASSITVEIKNGGKTYIRVSDNGSGISGDDLPKAILRHATSKIKNEEDLNSIATLGFRGEALASICAVSKLQILSCEQDKDIGYRLEHEGENRIYFGEAGSPKGTTVVVRDLFFNTPARMKFLKKDSTEASYIQNICEKVFLSHPDVSFRFIKDGVNIISTPGDGKLISAVHAIYGSFSDDLVNASYSNNGFSVSGLVSKPTHSRSNRNMQIFFINGRYVKSKTLYAAIEEAYRGSIMVGKFPSCVLFLQIPFDLVDVNVHPAKTEVRFADEKRVFEVVYRATKEAIVVANELPVLTEAKVFQKETEPLVFKPTEVESRIKIVRAPSYSEPIFIDQIKKHDVTPQVSEEDIISQESFSSILDSFENLRTESKPITEKNEPEIVEFSNIEPENSAFKFLGELFETYILCEYKDDLILIDKHAAHERMIYEELKAFEPSNNCQTLIAPIRVTLSGNEMDVFKGEVDLFKNLGFFAEEFGPNILIIREAPTYLSLDQISTAFLEILDKISKNIKKTDSDIYDDLLHSIACRSAVKAHDRSSSAELIAFAQKVIASETRYCPHGRPVIVKISKREIEKKFFRIQ